MVKKLRMARMGLLLMGHLLLVFVPPVQVQLMILVQDLGWPLAQLGRLRVVMELALPAHLMECLQSQLESLWEHWLVFLYIPSTCHHLLDIGLLVRHCCLLHCIQHRHYLEMLRWKEEGVVQGEEENACSILLSNAWGSWMPTNEVSVDDDRV